jgi:hypothetical protein
MQLNFKQPRTQDLSQMTEGETSVHSMPDISGVRLQNFWRNVVRSLENK